MTKNLNHVAGFPIRKSFPFPLLRMEISEIRSTLTISFYPHILKLKGTYELINYLNIPKHFMVFLGWNWRKQRNINRIKWNMMPWLELLTRIKIEKLLKESHIRQWIPGPKLVDPRPVTGPGSPRIPGMTFDPAG